MALSVALKTSINKRSSKRPRGVLPLTKRGEYASQESFVSVPHSKSGTEEAAVVEPGNAQTQAPRALRPPDRLTAFII